MKFLTKSLILAALSLVLMAQSSFAQEAFKPSMKFNGRIQSDIEILKMGDLSSSKFEFRRVHFSVAGHISRNVKYKIETDFAHAKMGFRDVFIEYTGGKLGNFIMGSYAEPTSLNMLTSSKYITFFERSMVTTLQDFRWGGGFHYNNFNIMDGKVGLQMAYTFKGLSNGGFKDDAIDQGGNFIARVSSAIINNKENHTLVYLGANYDNRVNKEGEDFVLKFRPENHTGDKTVVHLPEAGAVEKRSGLGFETAVNFGSLSIQGEYKKQTVTTDKKDFGIDAYYAMASYFLTGEYRPYKHGAFGRVKPKKSIDDGGYGALELVARYSVLDSSDELTTFNGLETNGKTTDLTFGLNWYLNAHTRIMYNFINTDFGFTDTANQNNQTAHLFRVQMDF